MIALNKNSSSVKVASNTFYQLVGKFSTMTVTIIATLIVTRVYGREDYGAFSLMQNWPALFYIIADFGLNAIATRELSKDFSKANLYLSNVLFLRLVFSLFYICFLAIILGLFPYDAGLTLGIRFSLFLILTQSLFTTLNIVFQTKMAYKYSALASLAGYIVIFGLILLFASYKVSIIWISFSYVIGGVVTFIVAFYFVKKLGVSLSFKFDKETSKYLFYQSLPLGIMFIFSQLNFKEDEILISVLPLPQKYGLSNTESVGIYSLPYKIFDVALVVPTFFMNAVYPLMVKSILEGPEKIKRLLFKTLMPLGIGALFVGLVGILFSEFAIEVLGGDQFQQSVLVLKILLGGLIFYYLTQPISFLIVSLDKQKYLPYIYLVAALFNLVLNLIFIPKYSFYGAAVITHVSEALILVMLIFGAIKAWKAKYA